MKDIVDVRRQLLVYEDNDVALRNNRLVLDYENRMQMLGELKIKEYRVLMSRLEDALQQIKKGKQPLMADFILTVFIDEEDEKPFKLSENAIVQKMASIKARIEELQEILKIHYV